MLSIDTHTICTFCSPSLKHSYFALSCLAITISEKKLLFPVSQLLLVRKKAKAGKLYLSLSKIVKKKYVQDKNYNFFGVGQILLGWSGDRKHTIFY